MFFKLKVWNKIGFHGPNWSETATPNMDYLAFSGIILNRFYANGGLESLFSGCYRRSKCATINLMNIFFKRNGYNVNFLVRHEHDKIETFEKGVLEAISDQDKPFLAVVDFGTVGNNSEFNLINLYLF